MCTPGRAERQKEKAGDKPATLSFVMYENKLSSCTAAPVASAESRQGNGMTSVTQAVMFLSADCGE